MSGGQTGVDRAALDVARSLGIPIGGWCPLGGWAEDEPEPPGLLARYPELRETPTADPAERTAWNVRDSDAVLVLVRSSDGRSSPGTDLTIRLATESGRPVAVIDLDDPDAPDATRAFLRALPRGTTLDVAGPRASGRPGLYTAAVALLRAALDDPATRPP